MQKIITRRDLLKGIIAGSGGIVAAGFVPDKWLKPVVKSGVLPVHAQASAPQPTSVPDLFIRGGYYPYSDQQSESYGIMAFAFVSYQNIDEFSAPDTISKIPAFVYPEVNLPAKDESVTLFINGIKEEPIKNTDEKGLAEWFIEFQYEFDQEATINPNNGAELIFKLDNGKEFEVPVIREK